MPPVFPVLASFSLPLAVSELQSLEGSLAAGGAIDVAVLSEDLQAAWAQVMIIRNALRDQKKDMESAGDSKVHVCLLTIPALVPPPPRFQPPCCVWTLREFGSSGLQSLHCFC